MKAFTRIRFLCLPAMIILVIFLFMPCQSQALRPLDDKDLIQNSPDVVKNQSNAESGSRLTPINENQLDELSPSLTAPEKKITNAPLKTHPITDQNFRDSVCFKRCHSATDFHPSDNTARQWRLLIEDDGHALFEEIPWESLQEKEEILNYLLNNSKNTSPAPAGIGVW
ncbi:MAG: hypothetical protein COX19_00570 [Desulfobacterales bacterium CG23_combo_of_CG06-09_8_20_14_all_51_8]|nr:MAG: hypothetical protein COX19_00570 [Desulfobacterales bacterium CG23_combo_of_CG06-09_8_20_14_all_51_8]